MAERRRTQLLSLLLTFTAATAHATIISILEGRDATLPCGNRISDQMFCEGTTWSKGDEAKRWFLIEGVSGDMGRHTVSPNCSLVIKKVTTEDTGLYYCHPGYDGSADDSWEDDVVFLYVISTQREFSLMDYLMLAMHGAELLLVTVVTVCLVRALWVQRSCDNSSRRRTESEDGDDVSYDYPAPPV